MIATSQDGSRLRDFRESDRTACLALFDSNVPVHFLASERQSFADFLENPSGKYYVLETERGEIVGCGGWYVDGAIAGLTWGIVDRAHQGRGLGRFLLAGRLGAIREDGRGKVARVRTTPATRGFFERAGFAVVRIYVDDELGNVPLVELTLPI